MASVANPADAHATGAAAIYSMIGTAKRNGVNPLAYLREVFTKTADHPINRIDGLLSWNVKLEAESAEVPVADDSPATGATALVDACAAD